MQSIRSGVYDFQDSVPCCCSVGVAKKLHAGLIHQARPFEVQEPGVGMVSDLSFLAKTQTLIFMGDIFVLEISLTSSVSEDRKRLPAGCWNCISIR